MNELNFQKELIDAVEGYAGAGHKMSHRFLVGVADLLIKLPRYPAVLIESKHSKLGPNSKVVRVEPTALQFKFLRYFRKAGMLTSIMSTIDQNKMFGVTVLSLDVWDNGNGADPSVSLLTSDYVWCPMKPDERKAHMLNELIAYLKAVS